MAEGWRAPLHDAASAWLFLTRVPVPWHVPDVEARLGRATPWFPAVGAAVGAAGALAWWLGDALANPLIGAVAAVATTVLVTGAFHEDGLADTFDGLGGAPDRERALAIMADSRLGAFGAVALVLVLVGRIAALVSLGAQAPAALVGAHALARLAGLPLLRWLPSARDRGTTAAFAGAPRAPGLALAALATLLLTALLWGAAAAWAWLAAAGVVLALGAWFRRRLGGVTGDALGATSQLAELAVYLALLA